MPERTLTFENLTVACTMVSLLTILVTYMVTSWLMERSQRKRDQDNKHYAAENEKRRIDGLPKLDTRHLLALPEKIASGFYGEISERYGGKFSTRYNRVAVIDRNGSAWVGLLTPDVIVSLRNSEYIHTDFWVPFRGPGEAYRGVEVELEEVKIDIYPFSLSSDDTSTADWQQWLSIEKSWSEAYPGKGLSYRFALDWIYPVSQRFAKGGVK